MPPNSVNPSGKSPLYHSSASIPLVLGTAQLGMPYGIANQNGKPDIKTAIEIIASANQQGIRFFDTAQAYGDSEKLLGRCFKELNILQSGRQPSVISKIDPSIDITKVDKVLESVDASLNRLGVSELYGLLLHRQELLEQGTRTLAFLVTSLKKHFKIRKFGVSAYSIKKAIEALSMDVIDIIQIPFNLFDQRALEQNLFDIARVSSKGVFVRSIYLQGLLTLTTDQLPPNMSFCTQSIEHLDAKSVELGFSAKTLAMAYAVENARDAFLVIGAETPQQVFDNVTLYHNVKKMNLPDLGSFATKEQRIIDPSQW